MYGSSCIMFEGVTVGEGGGGGGGGSGRCSREALLTPQSSEKTRLSTVIIAEEQSKLDNRTYVAQLVEVWHNLLKSRTTM